jgi:hypothetical protein
LTEFLRFESAVPDDPDWDGELLTNPAGRRHSELIRSHLAGLFPLRGQPWNEEDYAWEFQVEAGHVTVSVLVGAADDEWLVLVIPVALLGFLWRTRTQAASRLVADALEAFLRGDARFINVCRGLD